MENPSATRVYRQSFPANSSDLLGPFPATSVATLADLGLSDQEIARYFRTFPERIARIRTTRAPELRQVCAQDCAQDWGMITRQKWR
jgi:hypothetical protein